MLFACIQRPPTPQDPSAFKLVKGDQSDDRWLCIAIQDLSAGVAIVKSAKKAMDWLEGVAWPR